MRILRRILSVVSLIGFVSASAARADQHAALDGRPAVNVHDVGRMLVERQTQAFQSEWERLIKSFGDAQGADGEGDVPAIPVSLAKLRATHEQALALEKKIHRFAVQNLSPILAGDFAAKTKPLDWNVQDEESPTSAIGRSQLVGIFIRGLESKIIGLQIDLAARPPVELEAIYERIARLRAKLEDEAPDTVAEIKGYRLYVRRLEQALMKIRRERLSETVVANGIERFPGTNLEVSLVSPLPEDAAGRGQILRAALDKDLTILVSAVKRTARQLSYPNLRR